jgi:hypothetical protein
VRASQAVSEINKLRLINTDRGSESLPLRQSFRFLRLRSVTRSSADHLDTLPFTIKHVKHLTMQRCACHLTSVLSVAAVHGGPEVVECRTCGTRILTGWKEWPTLNAQERRRYFTDVRRLLLPAGVHLPVPTNHGIARTVVIRASTSTCSATASKRLRPRGLLIRHTRERLASRERESARQNLRGRRAADDYGYYTAENADTFS